MKGDTELERARTASTPSPAQHRPRDHTALPCQASRENTAGARIIAQSRVVDGRRQHTSAKSLHATLLSVSAPRFTGGHVRLVAPPLRWANSHGVCLRPARVPGTGDGVQASDRTSRKTSLTAPPSLPSQNISHCPRLSKPANSETARQRDSETARQRGSETAAQRHTPFPPHNNISHQASVTAAPRYLYSGVSRPGDSLWRRQNAPQMRPAALHSRPACHLQITQPTTRCPSNAPSIATTTTA